MGLPPFYCLLLVCTWLPLQLLAPEVRKEQNTLLQCIRYIVDTGFLGLHKTHGLEEGVKESLGGVEGQQEAAMSIGEGVCRETAHGLEDSSMEEERTGQRARTLHPPEDKPEPAGVVTGSPMEAETPREEINNHTQG